jgi:DNA-binding MarR family transcriptional regulator
MGTRKRYAHGVATTAGSEAWRSIVDLLFSGAAGVRLHNACDELGVAPGAFKLLVKLEPGGGIPMGDVAEAFGYDASYVTSLADSLEQKGLVERRPHPSDRRVKMLAITTEGERAKERAYKRLYEPPASFSTLSATEQRQLRDLLRKVAQGGPTHGHVERSASRHRSQASAGADPIEEMIGADDFEPAPVDEVVYG